MDEEHFRQWLQILAYEDKEAATAGVAVCLDQELKDWLRNQVNAQECHILIGLCSRLGVRDLPHLALAWTPKELAGHSDPAG